MSSSTDQIFGESGHFRIFAQPRGGTKVDITMFRGAPTQINSMSSTDPFGDATAQLTFPQITGFDRPGQGDLKWLVPWVAIDIVWYNEGSPTSWVWEGFQVSEDISGSGYSISLKGALYELDNLLAAPWYPQYPVPYELLIQGAFNDHPGLRTGKLTKVDFPEGWNVTVPNRTYPDYLWFLRPWKLQPGVKWTGLTTRNTGGWEPLLTGFVQTLLSVMYTADGGQWTVRKRTGRVPVLMVRPEINAPNAETLHVWYGSPQVEVSISRDFTQSANVIYGQGSDLAGTVFSGQQISRDGQTTYHEPFAALPYVYPDTKENLRRNTNMVRKESRLQFPNGMSLLDSKEMSVSHLRKFSDPGYVGTINLGVDPLKGGNPYNRMLIRAGMSIVVHDLRGTDVLFHISETSTSPMDLKTSLTVDTKYRDALTIYEVRAKTRDALDPVRLLKAGQFSVTVQDTILPWSYTQGSGVMPSGGPFDATKLFREKMGANEPFPWVSTVKKYPPKKYPSYYIKIGPRNAKADRNWSGITRENINYAAHAVRMSQAGTIRLTQIAAYDEDGNVVPVRFHVAFYAESGVNVTKMPRIPAELGGKKAAGYYPAAQFYPFFPGAFEMIDANGQETSNSGRLLAAGADMRVGYGNYYEAAGYFPGLASKGNPKTGLLSDEATWTYDTTGAHSFDKQQVEKTKKDPTNGLLYVMIYCDDQGTKPVYFLGRMFRSEAG